MRENRTKVLCGSLVNKIQANLFYDCPPLGYCIKFPLVHLFDMKSLVLLNTK